MFDLCVDVRFRFEMSRLNDIICIFVLGLVCGEVRHMSNLIARWRPKRVVFFFVVACALDQEVLLVDVK